MVEMEMGNAPPRDFITKNLKINPEEHSTFFNSLLNSITQLIGVKRNLEDIIDLGRETVMSTQMKIDRIQQ